MNGTFHGRVSMRGTRFGRGVLFGSFGASTAPVGNKPTDVTLSASSILETALPNTIVATISSNGDAPWLYSIIDNPDGKFRIVGSNLVLDQPLDYETATSHNVTIRAANLGGFHDKELTISVIDVVEAVAPTVVNLSTASVLESAGIGSVVAAISSDGTAPVTYSIEADPDGKFRIEGSNLVLDQAIDFETDTEHPVTIRATNAADFALGAFTITVTDVAEAVAPTVVNLSTTSVSESASVGAVVATISSDGTAPVTYTIEADPDGKFRIEGSNLVLDQAIDFETDTEHPVTIRATNAADFALGAFTITVTDVVEAVAPTVVNLSATSVPESAGIGALVATISSDGTAPVTYTIENDPDGKFAINGNALELAATIDFATDNEHPVSVRATNAAGFEVGAFTINVTAVNAPFAIVMGFQDDEDEGTDGDWFVCNMTGDDDLNDGLTPETAFATGNAALAVAESNDVISVRGLGDAYREKIDTHAVAGVKDNITFKGHGTEKPIFKGSYDLTGAVVCTSGDESVVGSKYASIYKVENVPKTNFVDDDPFNAALLENDEFMTIAMGRQPNPRYNKIESYNLDWRNAETTNTQEVWNPNLNDGAGDWVTVIVSHTLPWLANFTKEQIERCDIRYHRYPNGADRRPVLSYDPANHTVTFERDPAWAAWYPQYETNQYRDRFALVNLLPQMQKGQWGFADNGDGTVNLYFWPSDVSNVDTAMEYCAFDTLFNIRSAVTHMRSLVVKNTSASNKSVGSSTPVRMDAPAGAGDFGALTMHNCLLRNSMNKGDGYGLLFMRKHNNSLFTQITFENSRNAFGVFFAGSNYDKSDGQTDGVRVERCIVRYADKSPFRVYANTNMIISDIWLMYSGLAAHANTGNVYEGGHKVLWLRVLAWACTGYLTWQESSSIDFVLCYKPTNFNDGRAIVDQNRDSGFASPASFFDFNGDCYHVNCDLGPSFKALEVGTNNAIAALGNPPLEGKVAFIMLNNVVHGVQVSDEAQIVAEGNNFYTNGGSRVASDIGGLYSDVYENIEIGDHTIKASSPTLSQPGESLASLPGSDGATTLAARWPTADFSRDLLGDPWDINNPGVGAFGDPSKFPKFKPHWIKRPLMNGLPVAGETVTMGPGVLLSFGLRPETDYQWCTTDDPYLHPDFWDPIPNATLASYTVDPAYDGLYLGCRLDCDGATDAVIQTVRTSLQYPLSVGAVLVEDHKDGAQAAGVWEETTLTFDVDGTPLLVLIPMHLSSGTGDAAPEVTVGAQGRAGGDGVAAVMAADADIAKRSSNKLYYGVIENPGTGTVTLQYRSTLEGTASMGAYAAPARGLSGFGVVSDLEGTTSGAELSANLDTVNDNTIVMWMLVRQAITGNPPEADSYENADSVLIENGYSGQDTNTNSALFSIALKNSPSQDFYDETVTFGDTRASAMIGVSLISGSVADVIAPILTSPTAVKDGAAAVTGLGVTTDEGDGVLYWGVYPSASTPLAADIVAGTGAVISGSQAVDSAGAQAVADQAGLTASTAYKVHYVHDDAASQRSAVSTSPEFVTDAGVTDIMAAIGGFSNPAIWSIVKTEAAVIDNVARFSGTTQSFTRIEIVGVNRRPVVPGTVLDLSFDIPRMDGEGRLWINVRPYDSDGNPLGSSVTIYDSNAEGIFTIPETRTKDDAYTVPANAATLEVSLNAVDQGSDYDIDNLMLTY